MKEKSSKRVRIAKQLELELPTWGGAREGAGRKRRSERPMVPHVVRPDLRAYNPVSFTVRVRADVPDLRQPAPWEAIVRTFRAVRGKTPTRFVHYSVQRNHLHGLAESEGRCELALGMQTFCTRFAKSINRCFARTGPVLAGRYHARELTTPTEVRNALQYVLLNARHHAANEGIVLPRGWIDPRSTAAIFDGWREPPLAPQRFSDYGTSPPQTWLLREGWRRHGLLDRDAIPGRHRDLEDRVASGGRRTPTKRAA
jgi:putative transposase